MEKKMIKYIFLLFLATLTVACCDGFCKGEKLCNQINSNKVSALNNYDICRIRRRNDYYEIHKPNGEFEMYLSIKKDRFYYKNYYSKKDSAMINALVDVIRVINKHKVYDLIILGTYHYYFFQNGDMVTNGATKYVSEHPNGIKIKDDWYYYKNESQ